MSTIRIATSFNIELDFPAAPFHRRLFAWVLDYIALIGYILGMSVMMGMVFPGGTDSDIMQAIYMLVLYIPIGCYHLISEILLKGQSVGKLLMKLRVVNINGGRPSISQVIIRWLIRTSDLMIIVIMIRINSGAPDVSFFKEAGIAFALLVTDVVLVNMTAKNQRLGDLLAGTMLIGTKQKAAFSDTIFEQVHESYVPRYPQVMRLSDRDINALKGILVAAHKNNDPDLAYRAAYKVRTHLGLSDNEDAFDFIETLLKDYNYLTAH